MLINIIIYLIVLASVFIFTIFYAAWFSQFLLTAIICIPIVSLLLSLPFMIMSVKKGFSVFCPESVNINDNIFIGINLKNNKLKLVPFLKVNIKSYNHFTKKHKRLTLKYGGDMSKSIYIHNDQLSSSCGCIEFTSKYAKVYDFTGMFFIPVKINFKANTMVIPNSLKPSIMPNTDQSVIVGYKAKTGGGFSDIYELRQYQNGDSLKNIHWKLSSKQDELIVREPHEPIYNKYIIKIELTNDANINNSILGRLVYVCDYFIKNEALCYAYDAKNQRLNKIQSQKDLIQFLINVYTNSDKNCEKLNFDGCFSYSILPDGEEVGTL